jgi:hypothetical protein
MEQTIVIIACIGVLAFIVFKLIKAITRKYPDNGSGGGGGGVGSEADDQKHGDHENQNT